MDHNEQIQAILDRNVRVERDKAWVKSLTRRGSIAAVTYATACLFLWVTENPLPFVHALVPTGGYVLSTLTLPWLKNLWIRKNYRG